MPDGPLVMEYTPDGMTLARFMVSPARVRLIQGPRGSGKSRCSCFTLLQEAAQQAPDPKTGKRKSRTYVIRRTFDELQRTTIKTWLGVFPEENFGRFIWSKPFRHEISIGDIEWEVVFLALDNVADLEKLKSAEISSAWINEFSEIERGVLDDLDPCLGRYPSKLEGGCARPFIIADTNPGGEMHWFSIMSGQTAAPDNALEDERRQWEKPDTWEIFVQPPAMFEQVDPESEDTSYVLNPAAENLKWLPLGYYENMIKGKARPWIRRNACNRPASNDPGTPVFPEFQEHVHVARNKLEPIDGHALLIGVDFGRTPACVIAQRVFDRWFLLAELHKTGTSAKPFARLLRGYLAEHFPGFQVQLWGDPAGDHMGEADDVSPFMMFRAEGFRIVAAPSNDVSVRLAAVREVLTDMVDGKPRFLMSPGLAFLKAALNDGYKYPERSDNQGEAAQPLKNRFSHIADALQYLLLGAGEGRTVLHNASDVPKARVAPPPTRNIFDRHSRKMGRGRGVLARRGRF